MALHSFGGVGDILTQPQLPSRGAPVPQEQLGLWQKFQQKLQNDPNFRMALLQTGLGFLKSPQIGESGFDVFANASQQGISTLHQLRQGDIGTERQERLDKLTERGVAAGESRAETAETAALDRKEAERARLEESKRQFDARAAAGDFGPRAGVAGSTGPEREAALATDAFLASGLYPRTEEGRALAALRSRGLVGRGLITPQDRFDFAQEIAKDIAVFNPEMSIDQVIQRAQDLANGLATPFNRDDPSTPADEFEGITIPVPNSDDVGTVRSVKGKQDTYVIETAAGVSREYSAEQIRTIRDRAGRATGG